jgi:hypothetical protein
MDGVTLIVGVLVGVGVVVDVEVIVGVGLGVDVVVGVGVGLTDGGCGTFATNPATHTGPLPDIPNALFIASLDGPFTFGLFGLKGLYIHF